MRILTLAPLFALFLVTGIATVTFADDLTSHHEVSVVSNGWHTAIVAPRQPLFETGKIPELADFPEAIYIEFGWGDRTYYPSKEKSFTLAIGAAIGTSPAVMHLNGLPVPPEKAYPNAEIVTLAMSNNQLSDLVTAIAKSFQRTDGARSQPVQPGLYANSLFYNAHGEFHLFNTCNTWTARMLQAAGVAISPDSVFMASTVFEQLRSTKSDFGNRANER